MLETPKNTEEQHADWLPIGTVVKLRNVRKLVMIYGRDQLQASSNKRYDYVSVPYPEGNISEEFNLFFNKTMIETVIFEGYKSEEEDLIKEKLKQGESII